jgi:hypothetical protein
VRAFAVHRAMLAPSPSSSPSKIRDGSHLAALTLTLCHGGGGMGEGSLLFIVFGRPPGHGHSSAEQMRGRGQLPMLPETEGLPSTDRILLTAVRWQLLV